jgi:hypothetical protein
MAFATAWLEERALFPELITEAPGNQTGIIVVVPAFDEPGIASLLDSLVSCNEPECKTEIIIVVNAPPDASVEGIRNNSICIKNIEKWKKENKDSFFRLYVFDAGQPSITGWGVGLARKTGMDEALRRFNAIEKPDGVIVSLDADCTVEKSYFTAICNDLLKRKEWTACSISFEHPLAGDKFTENVYKYVTLYELHMRYFYQGIKYAGYPYAFHTIGSAIAFKASAYVKAGGMNRKQAGEDFYLIQKLIPLGGYFALDSTIVHPSPRTSDRVPFGTGAVISKLLDGTVRGFLTYDTGAFRELHIIFSQVENLFGYNEAGIIEFYMKLPPGLRSFIDQDEWLAKITEIKNNTSGTNSFVKRFFGWFNMFRIVKYMNHVHSAMFEKQLVEEAAYELLSSIGPQVKSKNPYELLIYYRLLEKNRE